MKSRFSVKFQSRILMSVTEFVKCFQKLEDVTWQLF